MDLNYNFNNSMDGSINMMGSGTINSPGDFPHGNPNMAPNNFQNMTPEQLYQLQQINQQQIQQLTNQMTNMQMPQSQNFPLPVSPTSPTQLPGQQVYLHNMHESPRMHSHVIPATAFHPLATATSPVLHSPNASLNTSFNGHFQPITNPVAYPNTSTGINDIKLNQSQVHGYNTSGQAPANLNQQGRNIAAPSSLPLTSKNAPTHYTPNGYQSSNYSSSSASTPLDSPATPKKGMGNPTQTGNDKPDGPIFMQRPRQQLSSPPEIPPPPMSDRSSRSSNSSSIPGSPISAGVPYSQDDTWSDASGPRSPDFSPRKGSTGEVKSPVSIQNKPLQMKTRYPQDKCYTCMKKVYPMEKLGPVRGVAYHKLCFKCKLCLTQLNLKNFFHNQNDSYDISVYCKSHQPMSSEKGPRLDSESFEIKSALNAPKKDTFLSESERVPVKKYSLDAQSRDIQHARKAPAADLQRGTNLRSHAWTKSKRDKDIMPPEDVVRHDDEIPEYDLDSYNKHQVETTPDYT